jgi:heme A synthase
MIWLHRYAKLVAACTVLLIAAGGMVTSTGSGLAVPDWPNTYGWFMFSFPFEKWVGGIFYEHGHRLIASTVGFLTIILALWTWIAEPRRWVRWLGVTALGAVILQGLLGGLTVLLLLPPAVSIGHAGLAQLFFCITVSLAIFTSPTWKTITNAVVDPMLQRVVLTTTILVYCQILIGATMRHTAAGLAIPDFPLMFGRCHRVRASRRRIVRDAEHSCNLGACVVSSPRPPRAREAGDSAGPPRADTNHTRRLRRVERPSAVYQHRTRREWCPRARDVSRPHAAERALPFRTGVTVGSRAGCTRPQRLA